MNRRNVFKFILDALMLAVLVLLYNKRVISMSFHELGGLILIGVFMIHILINGKWVRAITPKFFSGKLNAMGCVRWIVDTLLLVSFAAIGFTGVMISKKLFGLNRHGGWQTYHYFFSALSVVLMGVHLGLHVDFISGMGKKLLRPNRVVSIVLIVVMLGLSGYGAYSVCTTSFGRWLTGPFRPRTTDARGFGGRDFEGFDPAGMNAADADAAGDNARGFGEGIDPAGVEAAGNNAADDGAEDRGEGGLPMRSRGRGQDRGKGMDGGNGFSPAMLLKTVLQYLGEMLLFALLTRIVVNLTKKKRTAGR